MNALTQKLSHILKLNLANNYTSVSYAIMQHGEIIAAEAVGNSGGPDKKPSTINDTYNVASVSKIMCTLAVMKLVEQGKVTLDEPIYKYLPRFTMLDPRYKQITLRHCLSHASGLPGTQWKGFSVTDVSEDNYYEVVYEYMANNYLKAAPGEYTVYCNDGFTMAELVVTEVSKMRFSAFCEQYITGPVGAKTTKLSDQITGEYTLVRDGKKPPELLYIQGGAGYTTSMVDLCKVGNLILHPDELFAQSSIDEMAKNHAIIFLPIDNSPEGYGLGWDNVNFIDKEYDLGEGVLIKGGNSFQFTSMLMIIPKYDAVLAISETHNSKIVPGETILRLFATAMLDKGINIYTKQVAIPEEMKRYAGKYLVPNGVLNVEMYGTTCNINYEATNGNKRSVFKNWKFNGEVFTDDASFDQDISFTEHGGEVYLLNRIGRKTNVMAQKAKGFAPISESFKKRIGKQYVVVSTTPYDLVIYELMTGFKMTELEGHEGIMIAAFSGRDDADIYGGFDAAVKEVNANCATGFINSPNASRDLVTLNFRMEDGVEYCDGSSYTYRDVATLEAYNGQGFHQGKVNKVYKLESELTKLPEVPNGRRLLVLSENLVVVYDSMYGGEFKSAKTGYISFV